eukprot:CAMPEP_0197023776 /NCGR_PEP_ID=MMETSP1384-20130603/4423_1 /TAXON_ID=29189 /ORGANISM="Ammonia sp." /LENGTH=331 /DNA_ID=CAMNT_0042452039 /DNA_START=132 /DNA_END=1127 /DNA_ORIENTATION=-
MPTTTEKWPWMISIRFVGGSWDEHFCGGTVIRRTKPAAILTAGHCVEQFDGMSSSFGSSWNLYIDINRDDVSFENHTEYLEHNDSLYDSYRVHSYVYHPQLAYDAFYENTAINDVALLFIDSTLPRSQRVITLNHELDVLRDGDAVTVIGYGWDSWESQELTATLEESTLLFINDTHCNLGIDKYFREHWSVYNYTLFLNAIGIEYGNMDQYPYNILQCEECIICAVGEDTDACSGDSGSPLILGTNAKEAVQVGLVSYGFECNVEGVPAQYTDIAYYYDWIQDELSKSLLVDTDDDEDTDNADEPTQDAGDYVEFFGAMVCVICSTIIVI